MDARDRAHVEADLIELERQSWQAWQARDGDFFEDFLSDDHVEVGFTGVTDKRTVVASVRTSDCVVRSYAITGFKVVRLANDAALLTYHATQDTTCGGVPVPSPVWASSLYVRRGGRWRNAAYQQTKDLRA